MSEILKKNFLSCFNCEGSYLLRGFCTALSDFQGVFSVGVFSLYRTLLTAGTGNRQPESGNELTAINLEIFPIRKKHSKENSFKKPCAYRP